MGSPYYSPLWHGLLGVTAGFVGSGALFCAFGVNEELQAEIESTPYCVNVPSLEEQSLSVITTKIIIMDEPTASSPSEKPTFNNPTSNPSGRPTSNEPTSSSPSNKPTDFLLSSNPSPSPLSTSYSLSELPLHELVTDSPTTQLHPPPTNTTVVV
eukprot:CAMPEP_0201887356 /NCGR_PEP_ID=MMETSP0902-20130614/24721_1 /ASSEMBLY_ACC=CAM_ASM_000551 /TAXON_ID=420261 /ORGANISM="Thalassiosira antarctica, Strain CCMP982" /LENGTH=154 /DNA_ID=CAMNT_0048417267 /DNA_START=357 /DNA_END=821 /DNA_ORIENTATION=-